MTERNADGAVAAAGGRRGSMRAVLARLRTAILDGTLAEGAVLSQVQLAQQFGVSRTPLREALRMLQAEGFIDAVPNRRVRVAPFSIEDLDQLYAMRIALEAVAVRISIPHFGARDFERMRGWIDEMQAFAAQDDITGWDVPHRAFHCALAAHAGERIAGSVAQLIDGADRYRRLHLKIARTPEALQRAAEEHEAIVHACEREDADGASTLLAQHLARTALTIGALIEPEHEQRPVRVAVSLFVG